MKKILSQMLAVSMILGVIPVEAAYNEYSNGNISDSILGCPITVDETGETSFDIPDYEPIIHEETIDGEIDFASEAERQVAEINRSEWVSTWSLSSNDNAKWQSMYARLFGDAYLKPYEKCEDGQYVTGNTNHLIIEETDLTLPGKNGLDVVIKRKYDNQDYNEVYMYTEGAWFYPKNYREVYAFENTDTGESINIGFLTTDDMYTYMYEGCHLKPINSKYLCTYTKDTKTIEYYKFEDIQSCITTDVSYDKYEYNADVVKFRIRPKEKYETSQYIDSYSMLGNYNRVGNEWSLLIPEAYVYKYDVYADRGSTKTVYYEDYVGAFRDITGAVYTFYGDGKFTNYKDDRESTYTSSFSPDRNNYLRFECMYEPKTLYDDGPMYNFVVYDARGLTYYLYNIGMTTGNYPNTRQPMSIIAIQDEYGNMIQYEYGKDYADLTKIIDTYGREIHINDIDGGHEVSYFDDESGETKSIQYLTESLPASALDNDSPIKGKSVNRFTVVNQEGERTIYDSRETETINYFSSKTGYINKFPDPGYEEVLVSYGENIERIIYPTGAETRYRYKSIMPINSITKMRCGVYAVEASYDIVDGQIENEKEYTFSNSGMNITNTCINASSNEKTVSQYDDDGLLISSKTTPVDSTSPYKEITYTYDFYNHPSTVKANDNGKINTVNYSYATAYPNTLISVTDSKGKTTYSYHSKTFESINGNGTFTAMTDMVGKTTYSKKTSSTAYTEDFYISTELTADKKAIEFEKTVQNGILKSQTQYAYDSEGNIISEKQWTGDTNGNGTLDENDDILEINSAHTVSEQKTRNVSNTVSNVINADGIDEGNVTTQYVYNIYGSPVSQTDSYGNVTSIGYDDLNRPVQYTMANGGTRQIQYNTAEKYTLITDESGVVTKYETDGLGRDKAKYIRKGEAFEKVEEYTYDNCGRVASKTVYRTQTEGTRVEYTYDVLSRITQKKVYALPDSLLYMENYIYTNSSNQTTTVTQSIVAEGVNSADIISTYDLYNRKIKEQYSNNDTILTKEFEYDYLDRLTRETDFNGNATVYEYAYDGQPTKVTNAVGESVTTEYDLSGRKISVTDAQGNTSYTYYDKMDRVIRETAPFDTTRTSEIKTYYDKNSNIVKTAVKSGDTTYQIQEYKYDNVGNVLGSIANNGTSNNVVQYKYDTANRITQMITGLSEYAPNPTEGAVTQYSYDALGNLMQVTDPMGMSEYYTNYDNAGNACRIIDKNGNVLRSEYGAYGLEQTYFENSAESKEYTYDKLGRLIGTTATSEDGEETEESYEYDVFGRMIKKTSANGSVQNYVYDANSNIISHELKKNGTTQNLTEYTYDNVNRMTTLANNGITTSYTYDANGNVTEKALSNGVTTTYTYNNAGLMTYTETRNGENVYTYSDCEYMLNGLLINVEMPGTEKAYVYDGIGRLTGETVTEGTTVSVSDTYSYDLRGNRTAKTGIGTTTEYTYDLNNRLLSSTEETADTSRVTEYYYDRNGNTISKATTEVTPSTGDTEYTMTDTANSYVTFYGYNRYNRLTRAEVDGVVSKYTYNADNLRETKTVGNTTTEYVWDGQNLAAETKQGTTDTYTYDMTGVHTKNQGDIVTSYLKDYHGNVIGTADSTGRLDYDAYGNQIQGDDPDPFGYCGEYYDSETGLIYLRNRYYDPATSRMLSEDPARAGTNWYIYCNNNPVNYIDPTGLSGIKNDGSYYITHPLDEQLLRLKQEYGGASAKRKQEISIEAQNIRNSGTEGIDWSVRADRSLNYYMIDTDITNKLNNLMKTAGDENFWKRFADLNPVTNAARYADFAWMVRPGGQYDLKSKSEWQGKEHFIYNGEIIWYDDPGNILYGYLGKAMGFEDLTLLSAAGAVQILTGTSSWDYVSSFFDDPRDQKSIKMGIKRFKDTNSWIWW